MCLYVKEKQKKTGDCSDTLRYRLQHNVILKSANETNISLSSMSPYFPLILPQIVSPQRDREIETQRSERNTVHCVAAIIGSCVCTPALTCYTIWVDFSERGILEGHFPNVIYSQTEIDTGSEYFQNIYRTNDIHPISRVVCCYSLLLKCLHANMPNKDGYHGGHYTC